ncbi:hypothetical protein ABEB36_001873 [Hypothenemus hampei]|uniref:BZIP domain-containing protein n=1 Tax=Hypothenemus hampei TaxID=57062 RepID=A0ABD1FG15_HYPHA
MSYSMYSWKEEPVSPLSSEVSLLEDSLYQSAVLDDIKFENETFEDCETKAEMASQILENLENLVDLDELIKEEPSFLLDDKMIPLLDEAEAAPRGAVAVPVSLKNDLYPVDGTTMLFNELEKVYYELNQNHGALTPPHSPPSESPHVITTLGPTNYRIPYTVPSSPQVDIARELAVVEELIRTRAEDMSWNQHPSSPESYYSSGGSSEVDSEWIPEVLEDSVGTVPQTKKRSGKKPYSLDDKKSRKKEQNKNAATRYRLKKKAEVEEILNEEKQLLDIHTGLTGQITDLQREIKYLKGLMRDLFKAKGLIN